MCFCRFPHLVKALFNWNMSCRSLSLMKETQRSEDCKCGVVLAAAMHASHASCLTPLLPIASFPMENMHMMIMLLHRYFPKCTLFALSPPQQNGVPDRFRSTTNDDGSGAARALVQEQPRLRPADVDRRRVPWLLQGTVRQYRSRGRDVGVAGFV